MGKEDPFLTIGDENDRTVKSTSEYVWALKDINFEVKQGEILGIIGRNGAGKSTLLKILSRTTGPTIGSARMKGRIASLLEVGTGFHGELSGRENIFLNGTIMGMTKAEIKSKMDEIIDFAGVEKYIDTPVKRYSSGMYVRLAFAVAAQLEPDVMIVDEVLAVGDAEFQKKALGKMKDVSEGAGRTVLFVSHNMQAIQNLCTSSIYLDKGFLIAKDATNKILTEYLKKSAKRSYSATKDSSQKSIFIYEAILMNDKIFHDNSIIISLKIKSEIVKLISVDFRIISVLSIPVAFSSVGALKYDDQISIKKGINSIDFKINVSGLAIGEYNLSIDLTEPNVRYFDRCEECLNFEIIKTTLDDRQLEQFWNYGFVQLPISRIK
ncbi:MAG: ABC transporter ATP-binding protein [Ginsengibacter sp.]